MNPFKSIKVKSDSGGDRLEEAARHKAADWLARRHGGLTPKEQAEFSVWMTQAPGNANAVEELERAWCWLNEPRRTGQSAWVEGNIKRHERVKRRRRLALSLGGMAASFCVLTAVWLQLRVPAEESPETPALVATAPRPIVRTLADGSKVALRPGASLEVEYSVGSRKVRLIRGEALFTVAKDANRPFSVRAGSVEVLAVGTEFSVERGEHGLTVLVTEGRVAVEAGDHQSKPRVFASSGEGVVVTTVSGGDPQLVVMPIEPQEVAAKLAWRGTRLEFFDTPLDEAIRRFNEGHQPQIVISDPEIGRRTITGVLWAEDGDDFVQLLETGFDLVAIEEGDQVRLSRKQ